MATAPTPEECEKLPWSTLLTYSAPATAFSFYLFFTQFYFLKFATDVLLVGPAVVGLLFGASRLWDAASDPLVGHWSDRTRRPGGRRRPWMLAGIPLLALFFTMLWMPPRELDGHWLLAWSALALFGFYSAYTIYSIPHASLGAEITRDPHERTRIFGAQRMAFLTGMLLAFGAIGYVSNASEPREKVVSVVGLTCLLASLVLLLAPLLLRERSVTTISATSTVMSNAPAAAKRSPFRAFRDVLANRHARILLGAWFAEGFSGGVIGVLAPYVAQYVIHRPDLIAVLPAAFIIPGLAAIPVWVRVSRRFGKRQVWSYAVLGVSVFFAATFFVRADQVFVLCLLLAGAGVCYSAGGAIGQSMLADTIDYDELKTSERKEGAYMSAWGFALKFSLGLTIALTGITLELSGFRPNLEQTPDAELTLRILFSGVPAVASLAAFLSLRRITFDEVEHDHVRSALAARRLDQDAARF